MDSTPTRYPLESVDNALRLLLILRGRGRVRISEIARELDVAPSTAHRLLTALCRRDFAVRDDDHGYHGGPALRDGYCPPHDDEPLRSAARPLLEQLSIRIGEPVYLMARDGVNVRFLDRVAATPTRGKGARLGRVVPAHCTSGGKALLADLPWRELSTLYSGGFPEWPTSHSNDLRILERRLAVVRRQGFAVVRGESKPDISAVGMCLRDRTGRAVAAATVAVPHERATGGWVLSVTRAMSAVATSEQLWL